MAAISRSRILIVFSLIGAVVTFLYYNTLERGTFVQWKPLGKPPADKVLKVIAVNSVETATGAVYHYEGKWVELEEALLPSHSIIPLEKCVDFFDLPSLDKFGSSTMECESMETGDFIYGYLTITALDSAGNIYSWRNGRDFSGFTKWITPIAGAIRGFLVAIPILLIIDLIRWLKIKLR